MDEPISKAPADKLPRPHRSYGSPSQVDSMLRNVINMCMMALPEDRQTIDEVEEQIRRMLDRAFRDMREDREAFDTAR